MLCRTAVVSLLVLAAASAQGPTLAGRVLAADGTRAANATLRLRWRIAPELPGLCGITLGDRGLAEQTFTADERGGFRLALPHRGPFELVAEHAGERATPHFPALAGAFVELQLKAPVRVAGTIVDATGEPLVGAKVKFRPEVSAWGKLAAYRLPETRSETTTDAAGRFSLPFHDAYLRDRRWEAFHVLEVAANGLLPRTEELLRPTLHCQDLRLVMVDAKLAQRRPVPDPPGSAEGPQPAVRAVLQQGGRPLAEAPVLWSLHPADGPPLEQQVRTDAAGTVATTLRSAATALGFVQVGDRWLPFARIRTTTNDLDLGTVEVGVRSVGGLVQDATGQPVAGARVAALAHEAFPGELPYVTYSDHGGRYAFAALPPGPLDLWAECGNAGFAHAAVAEGMANVPLRTPDGGVVTGVTVDADGKPLGGVWLVLSQRRQEPSAMPGVRPSLTHLCVHSDAQGQVLVRGLAPGEWQVIGQQVRDGLLFGGSTSASGEGAFTLRLGRMRE